MSNKFNNDASGIKSFKSTSNVKHKSKKTILLPIVAVGVGAIFAFNFMKNYDEENSRKFKNTLSQVSTQKTENDLKTATSESNNQGNESVSNENDFESDISYSGVIDEKRLFTESQLDEINEDIQETANKLNMNIIIYLGDSSGWSEEYTKNFADSTYDDIFGTNTDGVFYYMDLSEDSDAYDYISTSGIAHSYFDNHIDEMFENIFQYLPAIGEPVTDTQIQHGIGHILMVFENTVAAW